ncbi:LacI family DNA-binding transcriptional regulator [Spelaeicoccus albus]|uniref:LacI family DNA-binding transcriptional regulator n=1 Tax=Spelaeicoccus albus TaxID=1280376 RepID=UPI0015CE69D1|nr:LacI family DNA-binding transcriptional regulator [Spelaeicoccus albus]
MATLDEVAIRAGVSASTVSRVFSRPDKVSEKTRERVRTAAASVGFARNSAARALARGRTDLVGLLVPDLRSPYFAPIISAAHAEAERAGGELVIADSHGDANREAEILWRLRGRVDGMILVSPRSDATVISDAAKMIPIVTVNRAVDMVDSVVIDVERGTHELAAHILGAGHRTIAYIGGPPGSLTDETRFAALMTSADERHAECRRLGVVEPTIAAGASLHESVVHSGATAVVAYNGLVAYGLLSALGASGHQVPDDIAIASTDDLLDVGFGIPNITGIHQPLAQAGREATERLGARIAGNFRDSSADGTLQFTHWTISTTLAHGSSV